MTENKRFIYNKFDIVGNFEENELKLYEIDNNPSDDLDESNLFYVYSNSEANIESIVDKLNTLVAENEQLKADNNRLVNETAKIIAEHQRKVFDLIDEKIKEADEYFKQSYDSWYQGKFDVLTELKKELQE